jgi:hypothetical protein
MFEIIIAGNPDACRTEAEITDESGNRVVYEDSNGWHCGSWQKTTERRWVVNWDV